MSKLNAAIKNIVRKLGFDIRRINQLPFGVDYCADIQYCLNGKRLDIVFDVGANIGQTTSHLLKEFPDCQIYAFEPFPDTFTKLVTNTRNMPNVKTINKALGNYIGKSPMISDSNSLLISLCQDDINQDKDSVIVEVDTIDNFCSVNNINTISLLKTDTEGLDLKVIKGAQRLLSSQKIDYIYSECRFFHRRIASDFVEMVEYLRYYNYNIVSVYTEAVDDLGFVFGNVLFRAVNQQKASRFSSSPFGQTINWEDHICQN